MSPATWYAARAAGIVAYLLLTVLSVLGMALGARVRSRNWPRFAIEDVHRFVAIIAGVFIAIHVCAVVLDTWVDFSLVNVVVPFSASYRPVWTGLGTVALELLVAVALTTAIREHLPYAVWRRAHVLGFPVWLAATLHGVGAGTDRGEPWLLALYGASVAAVGATALARFGPRAASDDDRSPATRRHDEPTRSLEQRRVPG